jgi:hypothetical protein
VRWPATSRRFVLAGGAIADWLVAVAVQPAATALVNALTEFLGGAILLNVFVDELPPERHASFGWFIAGLLTYAVLCGAADPRDGDPQRRGA